MRYLINLNQEDPTKLQLNKANSADTNTPFSDFHFLIANSFVSSKIYYKCVYSDFGIIHFLFLMVTFLLPLLKMFTFLNLFDLQERLII